LDPTTQYVLSAGYESAVAKAKEDIDRAKAVHDNGQSFPGRGYVVSSAQATQAELERRELQQVGALPVDASTRLPEIPMQTQIIRVKIQVDQAIREIAESAQRVIRECSAGTYRVQDELYRARERIEDLEATVEVLFEQLTEKRG
jgi:hypothetical protein